MRKDIYSKPFFFAAKRNVLFAIAIAILIFNNRVSAQCPATQYGAEGGSAVITPTGCNNGYANLGAGAYYNVPVVANTYYNFSWDNNSTCISGFCAEPQDGNASAFSTNQPSTAPWFSGTTTVLQITAVRIAPTCFNSTSGVMIYNYTTPAITSAGATPNPVCQGSTLSLNSVSSFAVSGGLSWSGPDGFSATGSNDASVTNMEPVNAGVYTFVASNSGCNDTMSTAAVAVTDSVTASAGSNLSVCSNAGVIFFATGATASGTSTVQWTTTGSGTITMPDSLTGASYTLTAADSAAGSISFTLTANGNSPCGPVVSTLQLSITPAPAAYAGPNLSTCANSGAINISGGADTSSSSSLTWSSSGTGIFGNVNSLTVATYQPSGADISAGSVTLTLTAGGNGPCAAAVSTKTLTIDPLPNGTITGPATVCSGDSAILTFNFSVGVGPYDVTFTTNGVNPVDLSGISDGYTITVGNDSVTSNTAVTYAFDSIVDASGCNRSAGFLGQALVTYTALPQITSATPIATKCFGDSTGQIQIVASGNGSLTFSDDSANSYPFTSPLITGIPTGNYYLAVKDANGCSSFYDNNPVFVSQPALLTITDTFTNASCANVFDGTITADGAGGTLPYSYSLNGGPGQPGSTFIGLAAGTYTVEVTDANFCNASEQTVIANTYALSDSLVNQTNVSCFGLSDGSVTVELSGGVQPYSYSINGVTFQPVPVFTGLSAGIHVIILRDSKGCTAFIQDTITQPGLLTVDIDSVHNVSCYGQAGGDIFIDVTGGTAPYTFDWSNGNSDQNDTNLLAGTYNVTVSDSHGCNASAGATLTQPFALSLNIATYHNLSCFNDSSGFVYVTANGGVPPYSYDWSSGATTQDITGLDTGNYVLTVTDANLCSSTISQALTEPSQLTSTISGPATICNGAANGSVTLTPSGGTPAYSFLWSNGDTSQDLSNIGGGTYTVVITDANGCHTSNTITIVQPAAISITLTVVASGCNGGNNDSILTAVSGGTGPYGYAWSNSTTDSILSGVGSGTYCVVVTDQNGCSASACATITQPAPLSLNVATYHNLSCYNDSSGYIYVTANGGVPPYSYDWSNLATTQYITGLDSGTYSVTVSDAIGCKQNISQTLTEPAQLTSAISGPTTICSGATNGSVTLTPSGGTPAYSFLWSNGDTSQDLSNIGGGTYTVVITDANGCRVSNTITIVQPAAITINLTVVAAGCNGGNNDTILTSIIGGTGPYSYSWSNSSTDSILTGIGAGNYCVSVNDQNGCSASACTTITQPAPLSLNVATYHNLSCYNDSSGYIYVTANGGVPPYLYDWSNLETTQYITGLDSGSYTVTVSDASGCQQQISQNLTEPSQLTSAISGPPSICSGSSSGDVMLTPSGGTPGYTYLWNNGQTLQDLTGVSGGTYTVIITDANGCVASNSITIAQPLAITIGFTVVNVACNGGTNDTIFTTITGGNGVYTYSWSNSTSNSTLTGGGIGTYCLTVTDGNGCSASSCTNITEPSPLLFSASTSNVLCSGGHDGSVDVLANGGTFPYSYTWSNGDSTANNNGLTGGAYLLTITDANSCSVTSAFTLTEPSPIASTTDSTNVTCNGINNGAAGLTSVTGGTPPYTYLWSNFQGSDTISNLSGGLYYVIITDANGCQSKDSVYIQEPLPLIVNASVSQITCFNADNGSIALYATGGTPGYTYQWNLVGATVDSIGGLSFGNYVYTVTDNHNCIVSGSVQLANPPAIGDNFETTDPFCFGDSNGVITIIPFGGTPPYNYAWNNGDSTQVINGPAGTYYATITDSRGCTKSDSADLSQPAILLTSGVIKDVTCHGDGDGSVQITAYGGTLPYNYTWSNNVSTQNLYNEPGGNYFVTVTDAHGCEVVSEYIIHEPEQLYLSLSATGVSCYDGDNGTVTAADTGGTLPYHYLWNNFSIAPSQTGLTAGLYSLQLTDSSGCMAFDTVSVTQPTQISITGTVTNVLCFDSATGSVLSTVTGGTPAYTYLWSNSSASANLTAAGAGSYTFTVTDASHCTASVAFNISQSPAINLNLSAYDPVCNGGNSGASSVAVSGGVAPYRYLWSDSQADTTLTANHLTAGTYTVTVTDNLGCSVTGSATLTQPAPLVVTPSAVGVRCFQSNAGTIVNTVTGGTPPYIYVLNGVVEPSDTFTHIVPGTYNVVVTDVNGCVGTDTLTINPPSQISVTLAASDAIILTGMQTQLSATATSDTTIIGYTWSPIVVDSVDIFDYSACPNDTGDCPNPFVKPPFSTTFTVTVTNADSCVASDTITITVNKSESLFIPTAFTPNGDGLNDRFTFAILGANTINVAIYNRWGELVYSNPAQPNGMSNSYGWDGTSNGKESPNGTYVYQLQITYFDGTVVDKSGTIAVIR